MLRATRIPGYELHEVISESASKLIIRAFSHALQKSVILKVLKPDCPIDAVAHLKHEYRIASSLAKAKNPENRGIVKVYSLVKQEDISFLVLEDFGGISLDKIIASQTLDVVSCLSIAVQLATVLMSLHQNDIIHKDIKPSNIIVNQKTAEIKLTDFGIASFKEKNASSCQLEGSFAYMSPEQTGRINRAVDYRSDFYSLGVTLYEMLAFRLPFVSDDALELIHSHIAKQPPPLTIPQLAAIVMKLMAKNAGAEKVYFIIKQNNQLIIESSLVDDSNDNTVWQRISVTESYQLPVSLINYIERTQTYLALDDASQSL